MPGASTSAALNRAVHRYRAAPLGARLFVHGRAFLSDLAFVERFVPKKGFIVDLGCGHGLFACLLREAAASRRVREPSMGETLPTDRSVMNCRKSRALEPEVHSPPSPLHPF